MVTIKFDDSLGQNNSGACFTINARDQKHAKMILDWLKSKSSGNEYYQVVQHVEQQIIIEI